MANTIDTTALFFGAPASLTIGGVENGATITAPKVNVEATQYAPEFQGAGGPLAGAVFNVKIKASVEFDINELTAAKLGQAMPGSASTAGTGTPTTAGAAFSTTTDADTAIGDTILPVAATTAPLDKAQFLKIDTGTNAEFRTVRAVIAGAAVELTSALTKVHLSGVAVVRVVDLNVTTITWNIGRVPSTSFQTVILDGIGLDGRHLVVTVGNALADGKLILEMSDSAVAGSHVVMTGYYAGAAPTLCPVTLAVG
jgi:hypothetical protein